MSTVAVPGFVDEIRAYGRFDTEGCLNCGSCTVVCSLSNGHASFPRRPIQQALLGLKSSLRAALEPWLCYDCGDCAATCPRQTEPRESMMTLRRYLMAQYDVTGISSRIFRSSVWEIGALACHDGYAVHLAITVPLLLIELPCGKWSHVIYRPLALYFQAVKERAMARVSVEEVLGTEAV